MIEKQKLEHDIINGHICSRCACLMDCDIEEDCEALKLLKELAGYPSFDNSLIRFENTKRK